MTSAFRVGLSVVILGSALLLFGFNSPAAAGFAFNGAWACSSSLDHSPIGEGNGSIVGLTRMVITGSSVKGQGISRVEIDDNEIEATSSSMGTLTELGHGIIDIESELTICQDDMCQDGPPARIRCIGSNRILGIYHKMVCMDRTDKPEGAGQVSLATCDRQ